MYSAPTMDITNKDVTAHITWRAGDTQGNEPGPREGLCLAASMIESYIRQEFKEVSLLAMALSRQLYAFPTDRESLTSLVERINEVRDSGEFPPVAQGAPESADHPADELWVWLYLNADGSIRLTAFQGIDQTRVATSFDAEGNIASITTFGNAGAPGCSARADLQWTAGDHGEEGTKTADVASGSRDVEAAEDLIFRAALIALASPVPIFDADAGLRGLSEAIEEKLGVVVWSADESRDKGESSPLLGVSINLHKSSGAQIELGRRDGANLELRARVRGKQCSAWLAAEGRLNELASEVVLGLPRDREGL
jgi:hypothetical protein